MASKILILGSTGFVGGFLTNQLSKEFKVYSPIRHDLNLLDFDLVKTYLSKNYFDVIINCAGDTNSNTDVFDPKVLNTNVGIFTNFYLLRSYYGKFINFGSGAEFDRSKDINSTEEDLFRSFPLDHYGLSKNITAKIIRDLKDFYHLRLFGVFGPSEPDTRLPKRLLANSQLSLEDRLFDYFFIEDVLPVVKYCIYQDSVYKDINLVYQEKIKLSEFVNRFCLTHKLTPNIDIKNNGLSYIGSSNKLSSLNLKLLGLEKGIEKYK